MAEQLTGRHVAMYVSGSVAAYRAADVVTLLRRDGADVRVAMTAGAQHFVTPLLFQALSGNPVATSQWPDQAGDGDGMQHLALSAWAEVQVAVAASASLLARLAAGAADDAVTATVLACRAPLLVAPAMETAMWEHPATQANVRLLRERGASLLGPASGRLASGREGPGRLLEPGAIAAAVRVALTEQWMAGRRVIVTAGGTREAIDPVRFVGNHSSGKMGYAIAAALLAHGADVTLITAAVPPPPAARLQVHEVESAEDMRDAVLATLPGAAALVMAAAVADQRPAERGLHKAAKADLPAALALVPTPDVLSSVRDESARSGVLVVGFAAETHDVVAHARAKLERKGLDLIVANQVGVPGTGMGADDNAVSVIDRSGVVAEFARAPKPVIAEQLVALLHDRLTG